MTKASIVIPCYNDGAYIRDAVDSARKQTYPSLEIVIVDDGSEDSETREALRGLEEEGLPVLWSEHRGVAHARNMGIRYATGEYILPLDSDDLIEPEYLAEGIAVLEADVSAGIVYCEADFFEGRTGIWKLPEYSIGCMLARNTIFNAAIFRKKNWEQVGGYDETMRTAMEDWDFWLAILELGLHPVKLPKLMFHYRIRSRGCSYSHRTVPLNDLLEVYRLIACKHHALYANHVEDLVYHMRLIIDDLERTPATKLALNASNRWVQISRQIDWDAVDARFCDRFLFLAPWSQSPARLAFGCAIIQEITGCSDQELVKSVAENPYMQYLCSCSIGTSEIPAEVYQRVREKLTVQEFREMLNNCLREET